MHNIGVICKNDECTTCATARERTEPPAEDAPVVLPKLARHQPDDSLDEVLGVDRRFVEVVARVTGSSQLRKQKRARATGESVVQAWGDGAAVIRLAPSFRTASFVMWDQVTWSGAKFGERWTGEEDEATGLRVMGGSGTGNGVRTPSLQLCRTRTDGIFSQAVWRDSTLTKTLGYIFDAYGERVSPFFQFQRDLVSPPFPPSNDLRKAIDLARNSSAQSTRMPSSSSTQDWPATTGTGTVTPSGHGLGQADTPRQRAPPP